MILSVCVGAIRAGAFFISQRIYQTWAEIPPYARRKVRLFSRQGRGCVASPPSHTSLLITYLLGRRYKTMGKVYERTYPAGIGRKAAGLHLNIVTEYSFLNWMQEFFIFLI